jgi:hypothetical protein
MKYKIVSVINLETLEPCEVAIHRNRIGREVELMFAPEEGSVIIFVNPDYSTTQTTKVQEIIINDEDYLIFETKNSRYTLEVLKDGESK